MSNKWVVTGEEQKKADVQKDEHVVRFVRLKNGDYLREDNDIFPSDLLFNESILFRLQAVSHDDEIDYVDFHMKTRGGRN